MKLTTTGIRALQLKVATKLTMMGGPVLANSVRMVGDNIVAQFRRNIDSFTPGSVEDLTPKYKKVKLKKYNKVYPILRATDQLYNSIYRRVAKTKTGYKIFIGFTGNRSGKISNSRLAEIHANGMGNNSERDFMFIPRGFAWNQTRRIFAVLKGK